MYPFVDDLSFSAKTFNALTTADGSSISFFSSGFFIYAKYIDFIFKPNISIFIFMKRSRQDQKDPFYHLRKYDRWGNINPAWRAVYENRMPNVRYPKRKPKL